MNIYVNPYYIIARLFQENGRNPTSGTHKMDGGDGKKYYNDTTPVGFYLVVLITLIILGLFLGVFN